MKKATKSVTDHFRSGTELDAAVRRAVKSAVKAKRAPAKTAARKSRATSAKRKRAA